MIKTILLDKLDDEKIKKAESEGEIMMRVSHPNIIDIIRVFKKENPKSLNIVMEFAECKYND